MTKVVAFGAFVEILPGVEGLVHISELADHHVENPSEVVEPGAVLNVKILEIDEERRRLSLSIKRVEGQNMPLKDLGAAVQEAQAATVDPAPSETPDLDLSEEVFAEPPPEPVEEAPAERLGRGSCHGGGLLVLAGCGRGARPRATRGRGAGGRRSGCRRRGARGCREPRHARTRSGGRVGQ